MAQPLKYLHPLKHTLGTIENCRSDQKGIFRFHGGLKEDDFWQLYSPTYHYLHFLAIIPEFTGLNTLCMNSFILHNDSKVSMLSPPVLVNFVCHLGWIAEYPDIWLNIISGCVRQGIFGGD